MDNRRSFIKKAGLLGTALVTANSQLSSAMELFSPAQIHEIGLQLYTVRDELKKDVRSTISKISRIGYNHVETFYAAQKDGPVKLWGLSVKELKALLVENKLKSYSGHYQLNDFLTRGNGNDKALKEQIDIAAELGQHYLVVPVPPLSLWDKMTSADFKYMAQQLNKAGELCAKSGLKVGYHNHFWEFRTLENGEKGYDILVRETNPALVTFEMDLFWIEKSGIQPLHYFQKYPGRFTMWHVKDMDKANTAKITGGSLDKKPSMEILKTISYTEVGKGNIDFKTIFIHQKEAGLKYIFVEQDVIKIDPFVSITESYNDVKHNLI
ncbi:sugar phosphate isomerase/epimerase [Pedobacter sp. L105]|uniref:sugar phosphate isomerase/epimerase family protein n=1 Tax=Pedobacter sp. L105 TaxID=1641871 RepID=UPI00131B9A76|nr:sugar phosphate isomerase/epimerase [Pedobacter sp. L105]